MADEIKMTPEEQKELDTMLAARKELEAIRAKEAAKAEASIQKMLSEEGATLVTRFNITSLLYITSQIDDENEERKAAELTSFIKALLNPGIYDSIESAQKDGLPEGTFILIDDPNTPETEFEVAVIPAYVVEEREVRVPIDADPAAKIEGKLAENQDPAVS